jgi:hypothetical protein
MDGQIGLMTVEEAAQKMRDMGMKISAKTLREGIAQDKFPFGTYIKTEKSCVCFAYTRLFEKWAEERK